jgi:peroxiredoxin Q/BCP
MVSKVLLAIVALLLSPILAGAQVLEVGDPFPEWSLVDQSRNTITSASYNGRKYLVWFCPNALSPPCTAEGRSFRDHLKALQIAEVEVFGITFDEPETNAFFASNEGVTFPLLSDTERTLALAVGAAGSPHQSTIAPVSFLVGVDGRIVKVYENLEPVRHAQDVLLGLGVLVP